MEIYMPPGVTARPINRPGTLLRAVTDSMKRLRYSDDPFEKFISQMGSRLKYNDGKGELTMHAYHNDRWLRHRQVILFSLRKVQRDVCEMALKDVRYNYVSESLYKLRGLLEEL
jgi:hypothetical protein